MLKATSRRRGPDLRSSSISPVRILLCPWRLVEEAGEDGVMVEEAALGGLGARHGRLELPGGAATCLHRR